MKIKDNLKWIIVGVLLFCFTLIAILILNEKIHIYDAFMYNMISKFISPTMTKIVIIITNFADPITIVVLASIISLYLGLNKKDKKTAIFFCLNLVAVALLNCILKNIFSRTRPELINIITESGYSFPSGHSSIAMAFYGYLIYMINRNSNKKNVKIISTIILSLLILLIGLSRVYLGVHYASDVTAAFLISLSYLIIYTHVTDKNKKQ